MVPNLTSQCIRTYRSVGRSWYTSLGPRLWATQFDLASQSPYAATRQHATKQDKTLLTHAFGSFKCATPSNTTRAFNPNGGELAIASASASTGPEEVSGAAGLALLLLELLQAPCLRCGPLCDTPGYVVAPICNRRGLCSIEVWFIYKKSL